MKPFASNYVRPVKLAVSKADARRIVAAFRTSHPQVVALWNAAHPVEAAPLVEGKKHATWLRFDLKFDAHEVRRRMVAKAREIEARERVTLKFTGTGSEMRPDGGCMDRFIVFHWVEVSSK